MTEITVLTHDYLMLNYVIKLHIKPQHLQNRSNKLAFLAFDSLISTSHALSPNPPEFNI